MKNFAVFGFVILCFVFVSGNALAEGAQVKLPADVAACVNSCLSGTACVTQVNCDGNDQRVSALEQQLNDLKNKLFPKRTNLKPQVDRVKQLQEQLAALRAKQGADESEIARVAKALADETAKLDGMTAEIADLSRRMKNVEDRLNAIGESLAAHDGSLAAHDKWLAEHEKRIEKLELTPPSIKVGFHVGFVGLHAFNSGTDYTALPITASLSFPISSRVSVITEAGIAVSGDKYSLGSVLHGAMQYRATSHWSVDVGATSVWAGFDYKLKAAQASILADVGPTYVNGRFTAHGSVMAGPAFEPSPLGASFALGGMLTLGVLLP